MSKEKIYLIENFGEFFISHIDGNHPSVQQGHIKEIGYYGGRGAGGAITKICKTPAEAEEALEDSIRKDIQTEMEIHNTRQTELLKISRRLNEKGLTTYLKQ